MADDFDEILDELEEDDEGQAVPTWRATIRRGRLTLTAWAPWLIRCGPLGNLLPGRERAGVTIADLTVHREDEPELSVRFYATGTGLPEAERVLCDWAAQVGYRRVWLPDRLVTIDPDPDLVGTATVRCPVCRSRWLDSTPEFWLSVKSGGAYPRWCPMCGCELPQWTVEAKPAEASPRGSDEQGRWGSSGSRPRSRPKRHDHSKD